MIDNCLKKEQYFTNDYFLKSVTKLKINFWRNLLNNKNFINNKKIFDLIDLLLKMLDTNPNTRISASDALKHKLFS